MLFCSCIAAKEPAIRYVVDPYHAYSYEEMLEDASTLEQMYPDIIRLDSIGESVEKRDLLLIRFGNGDRKIFINGSIHACEYITTTYLMYMIDRYAYAYKTSGIYEGFDLKKILDSVTFCIVPMLNPDGVNLVHNGLESVRNPEEVSKIFTGYADWKANINGVDLNRNFDNNWYVQRPENGPSAGGYKGYTPLSEPESRAVARYLDSEMFWTFLNFHSKGEGLYGWDDPNIEYYPQLASMVSRIIEASNYRKFIDTPDTDYGTLLGYVRETYLKPALTFELCRYVYGIPYPDEDFDSVWAPARTFCLIVAEEVMNMEAQEYLVFQNNKFLHAFCDEEYAKTYAAKWANSRVLYIQGGIEKLMNMTVSDISVFVDGRQADMQAYNINGNNYFRLRDLATALSDTPARFDIEYDTGSMAVMMTKGKSYTGDHEDVAPVSSGTMAVPSISGLCLNKEKIEAAAYNINGNNYYKLRDIAAAINFGVTYDHHERKISIDTSVAYEDDTAGFVGS
jgi:hypothetical protein